MTLVIGAVSFGLLLAYANGANDNVKGVSTLLGSGLIGYRATIVWATVTTLLGSITALWLAAELFSVFSGKGLVPDSVLALPAFTLSVALAAALTVLLATRVGMPVSTTHSLVGALVGAGLIASPAGVESARLGTVFVLPLIGGPLLGLGVTAFLYSVLHRVPRWLPVELRTLRTGDDAEGSMPSERSGVRPVRDASRVLDAVHYVSGGAVSFARGLNDTPKIAALLMVGESLTPEHSIVAVGLVIAFGGLLSARRVGETIAYRVTAMSPSQGLIANLVTSALVIGASKWGVPVSTTHIAVGGLFGVGAVTGQMRWQTVRTIAMAWTLTLPLAASLGALAFLILDTVIGNG